MINVRKSSWHLGLPLPGRSATAHRFLLLFEAHLPFRCTNQLTLASNLSILWFLMKLCYKVLQALVWTTDRIKGTQHWVWLWIHRMEVFALQLKFCILPHVGGWESLLKCFYFEYEGWKKVFAHSRSFSQRVCITSLKIVFRNRINAYSLPQFFVFSPPVTEICLLLILGYLEKYWPEA